MSYREPTIVQNQSGLIIPQAIAKAAENISQAWSKQLSDQRKLNLAYREEDRKNDIQVADDIAKLKSNFGDASGGQEMLRTARNTQNEIADQLFKVRTEKNNRNVPKERLQELSEMEGRLLQDLNSVNSSFVVVKTTMEDLEKFDTNKATNFGVKHINNNEQYTFSQGLKNGEYQYKGYEVDRETGNLIFNKDFKGTAIKAGDKSEPLSIFNSDGFDPIGQTTQIKGEATKFMQSTFINSSGKGYQQGVLGDKTYSTSVPRTEDGKVVGTQLRSNTDFTETANAKFNELVQKTFTNITSLKTKADREDVLIKQYNLTKKDVEAYEKNPNDPELKGKLLTSIASLQASSLIGQVEISNLGEVGALTVNNDSAVTNFKLTKIQEGSVNKPTSDKGTQYAKRARNTMELYNSATRVGAGQQRGSNKDIFLSATGLGSPNKQISIGGKKYKVTLLENTPDNMISFTYGKPLYLGNAVEIQIGDTTYKAQDLQSAQDAVAAAPTKQNVLFRTQDGQNTLAHDFLKAAGLTNANQVDIAMDNPNSMINAIEMIHRLERPDASNIVATHFNN